MRKDLLTMNPIPSDFLAARRSPAMFPRSFRAQVGQRMAIWAGMLGFLFGLYATVEIIQTVRMSEFSAGDREHRRRAESA